MTTADDFNAEQRKRRLVTCVHFNGIQYGLCKAGIRYSDVRGSGALARACIRAEHWEAGGKPECPRYQAATPEHLDAEDAEDARALDMVLRNVSPCCEAPTRGDRVRACTKCGLVVFRFCNVRDEP
jgi:hypothetical protein